MKYLVKDCEALLKKHGRTWYDDGQTALFFNWTCSGFTVRFVGSTLKAEILSKPGKTPMGEIVENPWIGVVAEDGETLVKRIECGEEHAEYILWDGDEPGEHTIRIVKLSECARGKTALISLETDGELLAPLPEAPKPRIEFVGDSITCGYGNEAENRDVHFNPAEENGWITYGALAGRALDAETSFVCVSGISVCGGRKPMFPHRMAQMETAYRYTDWYGQRSVNEEQEPEQWDFEAKRNDIVVVNLGTNDVNPIRFSGDLDVAMDEEAYFTERYRAFIEMIRDVNGSDTWIVCTLGPLDHYLYDNIEKAVQAYVADTGDQKVCCFKSIGVNLMSEGFGADGHPSAKTHARMGREIAQRLRRYL